MKHISSFENFLNEKKDVKHTARIEDSRKPGGSDKDIKDDYSLDVEDRDNKGFNIVGAKEDIEAFIKDYGMGPDVEIEVYESASINEGKKPKSWDTMFAMNAIRDYEDGKFDPDDDASLAKWEKDYNGGVAPKPGFETYDIIAYAMTTGKKPDGSPIKEPK
jgi:hypothetical protein